MAPAGGLAEFLTDELLDVGAADAPPVGLAEALEHPTARGREARAAGVVGERHQVEVLGAEVIPSAALVR